MLERERVQNELSAVYSDQAKSTIITTLGAEDKCAGLLLLSVGGGFGFGSLSLCFHGHIHV